MHQIFHCSKMAITKHSSSFSAVFSLLLIIISANAADSTADAGNFFTYNGFSHLPKFNLSGPTTTAEVTEKAFPALNGQAVSMALVEFPPNGVAAPHIHPDAGEMMWVLEGTLKVTFVDWENKTVEQTIQAQDMFVFPKGAMHFQMNVNSTAVAAAVSIFGSAAPTTVVVAGIPERGFRTAALAGPPKSKCFLGFCLPSPPF